MGSQEGFFDKVRFELRSEEQVNLEQCIQIR